MIHVRALRPDDAPQEHRRCVTDAAARGVNLSFGLFDGDRLVGHLICCGFKPTIFPGETGEALQVQHVAVLPCYRRSLPRLIRRLGVEARRHFPGSAIEAHAVERAFEVWRDHPAFFARDGYAITRHADSGEMLGGEIRYLVRWQPIPDWEPAVPTVEELVARPRGDVIEVDGVRYQTTVVGREREWDGLASVWDRLLLALPGHTVFQTYEYQRLWWRHVGGDNELFIVLLVSDGEVRGIAPLQIETVKTYGRWSRRLGFIGSHTEVERPLLLFPADQGRLARALAAALAARAGRWDLCDLRGQLTGSDGLAALDAAFRSAGYLVSRAADPDSRASTSRPTVRLRVCRRTPFFLALHTLAFRLEPRIRALASLGAVLSSVHQLTRPSWRPDDQT
jgi:hypothetical protein